MVYWFSLATLGELLTQVSKRSEVLLMKFKYFNGGSYGTNWSYFRFMQIIGGEIWLSLVDPFMRCLTVTEIFMLGIQYAKGILFISYAIHLLVCLLFVLIKTLIMEMLTTIMIMSCLWKWSAKRFRENSWSWNRKTWRNERKLSLKKRFVFCKCKTKCFLLFPKDLSFLNYKSSTLHIVVDKWHVYNLMCEMDISCKSRIICSVIWHHKQVFSSMKSAIKWTGSFAV